MASLRRFAALGLGFGAFAVTASSGCGKSDDSKPSHTQDAGGGTHPGSGGSTPGSDAGPDGVAGVGGSSGADSGADSSVPDAIVSSDWPGPDNTGVPPGTTLSDYSGPCTITVANTVIDSKTVNCDLSIQTTGVVIKNSKINGQIFSSEETSYSFSLEDSEVDAGLVELAAVGSTNVTVKRCNIHGGITTFYCWSNCDVRDSWLHGQGLPPNAGWHLGGFRADDNGFDAVGKTNATAVHNTIACDTPPNGTQEGGCTSGVALIPDFGPISYVTMDQNLIVASEGQSYCVYGG